MFYNKLFLNLNKDVFLHDIRNIKVPKIKNLEELKNWEDLKFMNNTLKKWHINLYESLNVIDDVGMEKKKGIIYDHLIYNINLADFLDKNKFSEKMQNLITDIITKNKGIRLSELNSKLIDLRNEIHTLRNTNKFILEEAKNCNFDLNYLIEFVGNHPYLASESVLATLFIGCYIIYKKLK